MGAFSVCLLDVFMMYCVMVCGLCVFCVCLLIETCLCVLCASLCDVVCNALCVFVGVV